MAGTHGSGLDADVFRSRASGATLHVAAHGGDSRILVFIVPPDSELAFTALHSGFFGCGWAHLPATGFGARGPGNSVASVSLHGAAWAEAEHDHRVSD